MYMRHLKHPNLFFFFSAENCNLDLAFAVDGSGSIAVDSGRPENWDALILFVQNVILGFSIGPDDTRTALVRFDER